MMPEDVGKMSDFKWTPNREQAALLLAQGYTNKVTAQEVGVSERTIERWRTDIDFLAEVDRLTLMTDISQRAERLRIAMRAIRQKTKGEFVLTEKDILDWLKFAQSETDGAKLNLTALSEAFTSE